MLKIPVDDYRLHLQDDAELADNFEAYFPELEKIMTEENIDVLSLY